jgi:hydroxyethylthiazole kinase-like uncharacterized protein yjeF
MKIFTTKQIYEADKATIRKQGITSTALMERAALKVFNWLDVRLHGAQKTLHILCGMGNNGGDGLVVARHLEEQGYSVFVYIVKYTTVYSPDFVTQLERLKEVNIEPIFLERDSELPDIGRDDIVVDAIFGVGYNREMAPWIKQLIVHINSSNAFVLSIDVPSGLYMEAVPDSPEAVIRANHVLSFQAPKLNFFLPQTGVYLSTWEVLDIGLDATYLSTTETDYELTGRTKVLEIYRPRESFSHKGTYGHALMIGGSYGKIGAVILATEACLKSGSGMVTAFLPACGLVPIQTAVPEVMAIVDTDEKAVTNIRFGITPTVIGIGIGMGQEQQTQNAFSDFLTQNTYPLVLDADALNLLAAQPQLLDFLPPQSVLTPHPKELERLLGPWTDDFDKLKKAKAFSKKYNCVLVIKGRYTITLDGHKGYINITGNPGMATAGSGDVLTGIITGLVAQGYTALNAALFGVYLHGRAGDLAVEECGYQALTARTITNYIGKAYMDLFRTPADLPEQENG